MNNFLYQTAPKLKLLTTWLTLFCVSAHPSLFIFDLVYTTRNTLWLNLNYKKMLKFVNTINWLTLYCFSTISQKNPS